jgi:hypothetical protein
VATAEDPQGPNRWGRPLTVAGPRRISTGFPL